MNAENYLEKARELHQKALGELEKAKDKGDGDILRDACGKGWLSAIEATNAIFIKKGVKEEELPKVDRGRRYMVYKYADKELGLYYFSLRDSLHIEGYYEGVLDFDEVKIHLDYLDLYIQKVEELKTEEAK